MHVIVNFEIYPYNVVSGEKMPGYMVKHCPVTCNMCHLISVESRCTREALGTTNSLAILPDQFMEIFGRVANSMNGQFGTVEVLSRDPWIVAMDNFLFPQEVTAIIENTNDWGRSQVYNKSGVISQGRTSSNGWCKEECQSHPYVKNALRKVIRTATVAKSHFEPMQVIHYNVGESYALHHDMLDKENHLSGPRIFTFLVYLNDVEEGGETHFPYLDLTVKPKKGKALFWPNVYDHDPNLIDKRTAHEARAVVKGEKFVGNVWLHLYDYSVPYKWDCLE